MDASERRKRAAEEAAEWWVRLQGEVPRAEREQYVDWLRESAVHVAEMLRVAQVHGALAQFERWSELPTEGGGTDASTVIPLSGAESPSNPATTNSPPKPPTQTPRRSMLVWATAASLLIAAGLAAFFLLSSRGQIIETQRGERREVALTDGSVLQVDPETRIKIDYQADTRRVYLEHGRALFHVAKNPNRPFLVWADDTTVRAVGTAFAVEQAPNGVVVTVAEGRVAVIPVHPSVVDQHEKPAAGVGTGAPKTVVKSNAASKATQPAAPSGSGSPGTSGSVSGEIFLTANEQVTVAGSGTAEPVREVDSRRELAWAEGRLIFENDSVEHAVAEFNRYNRIQLTVNDAALAHRPISGVFSASDPESFVAFIQTVAAVRVTRNEVANITIDPAK